ncbi:MAG: MFS transporter, partial [Pseudomonadota bacterium]
AGLAYALIGPKDDVLPVRGETPWTAWRRHLSHPALRAAFAIGFAILFVFVGVFTYVNLYLTEVLGIEAAALGLVYLVFLPALLTTPFAAQSVSRLGPKRVFQRSGAAALLGVGLTLVPSIPVVLLGLAIIGAGTFFMQAAATGFVGRTAVGDRAAANGLYLTSYYIGGLIGAFALGQAYVAAGWTAVALIVGAALALTLLLAGLLRHPGPEVMARRKMPEPEV